jgi:heme/copper-type cytochrome/quinol oxidase subunit 2
MGSPELCQHLFSAAVLFRLYPYDTVEPLNAFWIPEETVMPKWHWVLGAVLALLILVACRDDSADPAPTPSPPATADSQPTSASDSQATVVDVTLSFVKPWFRPDPIVVQAGKPMQFKITSADTRHTFIIDAFNIDVEVPQKSLGETVTTQVITPQPPGTYRIYCRVHARLPMEGQLVVSDPSKP